MMLTTTHQHDHFLPALAEKVLENTETTANIVHAINSKPFSALTLNERSKGLSNIIKATMLRLGQKKATMEEISAMITVSVKDLQTHYPVYSMQDIELACELVCTRKLDVKQDVLFFSPSNLLYWLKCYIEQKRAKVFYELEKQREKREATSKMLSEEEQQILFEYHFKNHLLAIKKQNDWLNWGDNNAMCLHYFERVRHRIATARMWEELREIAPKMLKRFEADTDIRRERKALYGELTRLWKQYECNELDFEQLNEALQENDLWKLVQDEAKKACTKALMYKICGLSDC